MDTEKIMASDFLGENDRKISPFAEICVGNTDTIFTKGVFDLIHVGHLTLFSFLQSIKNSRRVVVGVASDRLTKRKKGEGRPINPERIRMQQVASMPCVDLVFLLDDPDLSSVIKNLNPAAYVKGMDTALSGDGTDLLEHNKELTYLPSSSRFYVFCDDGAHSTSRLIENIQALKTPGRPQTE